MTGHPRPAPAACSQRSTSRSSMLPVHDSVDVRRRGFCLVRVGARSDFWQGPPNFWDWGGPTLLANEAQTGAGVFEPHSPLNNRHRLNRSGDRAGGGALRSYTLSIPGDSSLVFGAALRIVTPNCFSSTCSGGAAARRRLETKAPTAPTITSTLPAIISQWGSCGVDSSAKAAAKNWAIIVCPKFDSS